MHQRVAMMVLALLLMTAAPAYGDGQRRPTKKGITTAECEQLVGQLVSKDKPPFNKDAVLDGELSENTIDTMLRKQYRRKLISAYNTLSDNSDVALPVLAKHADDRRFAYIREDPSGGWVKVDVGTACQTIVERHIEVYQRLIHSRAGPASLWFIQDGCGGLGKWWRTRKGKSLAELQLEACEWVLGHKKPVSEVIAGADWATALRGVRRMADELRRTKRPIVVGQHLVFVSK